MICKNCKKEINENTMFCPNCGSANEVKINEPDVGIINHPFNDIKQQDIITQPENNISQTNIDNKIMESSVNNINTNENVESNVNTININDNFQQNQNYNTTIEPSEKVNIGLAIISWFIPLVGIVLFFTQKDKKTKTAKVYGIVALISIILTFIITAISIWSMFSIGNMNIHDEEKNTTIPSYTTTTTKQDSTNNVDWKKYSFSINGITLNLPCTFKELENTSKFKLNDNNTNDKIKPNYYNIANMYHNGKLGLYVEVYNDSKKESNITNGKIKKITQTNYQVSTNKATPIIFPGNLKVGINMTKDEIIKILGTPTDVRTNNDGGKYITEHIKYQEDEIFSTRNYYEITIVNGVIDELSIDNINY